MSTEKRHQMACALAQIVYTISVTFTLFQTGSNLLQNTGNIIAYFNILNKMVVSSGIYIHIYIHSFRLDLVEAFVDAIQTSPIVKHCRTPLWKPTVGSGFVCVQIIYLTYSFLITWFGLDISSWARLKASAQMAARELFWWDRNADADPGLALCVAAVMGRLFDSFFSHISLNLFTALQLFCVYCIVSDFFHAMLEKGLETNEAMALFHEYVTLMNKANDYLGLYVFQYTMLTLTYHSIHLFDMLNSPSAWWKINAYSYAAYVVNFYLLLAIIHVETKKMKTWLWKGKHYMDIPYNELISILHDLQISNFKFGVRFGRFFTITSAYSGGMLAKMLSYSMLLKYWELHPQSRFLK